MPQQLEDDVAVRAADELVFRIYAAMAQKERELISERARAALAAARARGVALGGDRGYRPARGPDAVAAAQARALAATRAAHRLALEWLRAKGTEGSVSPARTLGVAGADAERAGRADAGR